MTASDWAFYILTRILEWMNPIVHAIGFVVCVWAYRACRKRGYLLVAIYFFLAVGTLIFSPIINRALADRSPSEFELSPNEQKQYEEELMELHDKYFPSGRASRLDLEFPIGPILLVFGLWLLARRDSKRITEPSDPPNDGPVTPVENSDASVGGRHR